MQTTPKESAAWAAAQVYRSAAARSDNRPFVRLAASRQEPPADDPSASEAADQARRSYPWPERRITDMGSGMRLAEPHLRSLSAPAPAADSRDGAAGCDDAEDLHRWPLAWIGIGFVLGQFDGLIPRALLGLLGVPALLFLASLTQ